MTVLSVALVVVTILGQGCGNSAKNDKLQLQNQKIDALSKKLDAILLNQAEVKAPFDAASQQNAIVNRMANWDYYYSTNELTDIDANDVALENNIKEQIDRLKEQMSDLKEQMNDIERQIKPQFANDIESLGDKVNAIKDTTDQIERDNAAIKNKLGILYQ